MPTDGMIIITDVGHAKLTHAVATQTHVAISHVALGDGNGAPYDPGYGQTALKRERARVAIHRYHWADDSAWRVTAEFAADDTPAFSVREIGFFDAEGALIFVWAGRDVQPRQTGAVDYLLDQVLNLDRVKNGVVVIAAPEDEVFDLSVATATALADLQLEQLRIAEIIAADKN